MTALTVVKLTVITIVVPEAHTHGSPSLSLSLTHARSDSVAGASGSRRGESIRRAPDLHIHVVAIATIFPATMIEKGEEDGGGGRR